MNERYLSPPYVEMLSAGAPRAPPRRHRAPSQAACQCLGVCCSLLLVGDMVASKKGRSTPTNSPGEVTLLQIVK